MSNIKLPGRRRRGRPQRRFMDVAGGHADGWCVRGGGKGLEREQLKEGGDFNMLAVIKSRSFL